MRWIDRLWREDQRVKSTPGRVAASLSDGIIRSTNLLRIRLLEQASSRADRKRFESEACILECLLFEWFLRDVVVAVEFGRHTDAIRRALSPAVLLDFTRLQRERFDEYRNALGVSISLQVLGQEAWLRIVDTREPSDRMTMLLAMRATAQLQALRGLGRRYAVISAPHPFSGCGEQG